MFVSKSSVLRAIFQQKRKLDLVPPAVTSLQVAAAAREGTAVHEGLMAFPLRSPSLHFPSASGPGLYSPTPPNTACPFGCMRMEVGTHKADTEVANTFKAVVQQGLSGGLYPFQPADLTALRGMLEIC